MAKKVFIVDDDNMYRAVLAQQFVEMELEVVTFATGEDCLENGSMPDILLIDYYLNSEQSDAMNGMATLRRIRERIQDLPVIVLSGRADLSTGSKTDELMALLINGNRAELSRAFRQGAFFYLMKDSKAIKAVKDLVRRLI